MRHRIAPSGWIALFLVMGACATDAGVSAEFGLRETAVDWTKVGDPLPEAQACWASAEPTAFPARMKHCGFRKYLEAMGEGPLNQRTADQAYRFLWLRTWHRPVMVRIERRGGAVVLVAKETDGSSESTPGTLAEHAQRTLSVGDWEVLERAMRDAGFWTLDPATRDVNRAELVVADGAYWIVEGTRAGEDRVVALYSEHVKPGNSSEENAALRDAALMMLELAGVDLRRFDESF